jgi:hypothetical protein
MISLEHKKNKSLDRASYYLSSGVEILTTDFFRKSWHLFEGVGAERVGNPRYNGK